MHTHLPLDCKNSHSLGQTRSQMVHQRFDCSLLVETRPPEPVQVHLRRGARLCEGAPCCCKQTAPSKAFLIDCYADDMLLDQLNVEARVSFIMRVQWNSAGKEDAYQCAQQRTSVQELYHYTLMVEHQYQQLYKHVLHEGNSEQVAQTHCANLRCFNCDTWRHTLAISSFFSTIWDASTPRSCKQRFNSLIGHLQYEDRKGLGYGTSGMAPKEGLSQEARMHARAVQQEKVCQKQRCI